MRLATIRALVGANRWSLSSVLVAELDGPADPVQPEHLARWLAPWWSVLQGETDPRVLIARLALALQQGVGSDVRFASSRPGDAGDASSTSRPEVAVEFEEEALGRAALGAATRLVSSAQAGIWAQPDAERDSLRDLAEAVCLGRSTRSIVAAARARNVPARRLNTGNLVLLGQGARQRRILTAETDRTGSIAEGLAQCKDATKTVLAEAGVPVPAGMLVRTAAEACEAVREVGAPVVIKPRGGNHARGVTIGVESIESIESAFAVASAADGQGEVLVERMVPGREHRLLIIGDRLAAAYRAEPGQVIGDGSRSIAQLLARTNRDPRRGDSDNDPLPRLELDEVARLVLDGQGLTPETILPEGATAIVRRTSDRCIDVTDEVHPEVAARAIEAAKVLGLDIAGIDLVVEDISRPLEEQDGAIVEVNARPGLLNHIDPDGGSPRDVGRAIVDHLFPDPNSDGRIPILAVTGIDAGHRCRVARQLAERLIKEDFEGVGLACAEGLFVGTRRLRDGNRPVRDSALDLLINPRVHVVVIEFGPEAIDREGLGFDHCHGALLVGEPENPTGPTRVEVMGRPIQAILSDAEPSSRATRLIVSQNEGGGAPTATDDPAGVVIAMLRRGFGAGPREQTAAALR
jgi:cyanophycin synthetase